MEALLKEAGSNNTLKDITGCLIYYDGNFIQLLVGDKQKVLELYRKIKLDDGHCDVHILSANDIQTRACPDWGMAYFPIADKNFQVRIRAVQKKSFVAYRPDRTNEHNR